MKKYAVWLTYGSFVLTSLIIVLLFSCDDSVSKRDKRALKHQDKKFEKVIESQPTVPLTEVNVNEEKSFLNITATNTDTVSYWFVVVEDKTTEGMKLNALIKQKHSYFSFKEAKAKFDKDIFIVSFTRIDAETYYNN